MRTENPILKVSDGDEIVRNILQTQDLPHTTEDSIFLSPTQVAALRKALLGQTRTHSDYDKLQVTNNKRLSCYEQVIVNLKSELAEMKGKEDEYKLQIRQLTEERNEWKRKAEVGCPKSKQSLKSFTSFPTKSALENAGKTSAMKRSGTCEASMTSLFGSWFSLRDKCERESPRQSLCTTVRNHRQNAIWESMVRQPPKATLLENQFSFHSSLSRQNITFEHNSNRVQQIKRK